MGISAVARRQVSLREAYAADSRRALVVDRGRTLGRGIDDPLHVQVLPGEEYPTDKVTIAVGTHRGVGGRHDAPNPGELLCASLAACKDSTIRMIADLLGVQLTALEVHVDGEIDLRGTLAVDRSVRVGFQAMRCRARLGVSDRTDARTVRMLLAAAERSCVVLDTLRLGVPVATKFTVPGLDRE